MILFLMSIRLLKHFITLMFIIAILEVIDFLALNFGYFQNKDNPSLFYMLKCSFLYRKNYCSYTYFSLPYKGYNLFLKV